MRWLLLALCSCNWVYGLDETRAADPFIDIDNDGVSDQRDNCPTPNNDQADSDDDGIGDACDGCAACEACDAVTNADHDEDGDKLADGCDPCPASADNTDSDGDGVGDACDLGPQQRVVLFDGFATMRDEWLEEGPRWTAANDRIGPDPDLATGFLYKLHHPRMVSATTWSIEVGVVVPTVDFTRLGVGAGVNDLPDCRLNHAGGGDYQLQTNFQSELGYIRDLPPTVTLRMSMQGTQILCEIVGTPHRITRQIAFTYPLELRLIAGHPDHEFTHILVAE